MKSEPLQLSGVVLDRMTLCCKCPEMTSNVQCSSPEMLCFFILTCFFPLKEYPFKSCSVVIVVWIASLKLIRVLIVRIPKKITDLMQMK